MLDAKQIAIDRDDVLEKPLIKQTNINFCLKICGLESSDVVSPHHVLFNVITMLSQ